MSNGLTFKASRSDIQKNFLENATRNTNTSLNGLWSPTQYKKDFFGGPLSKLLKFHH